MGKDKEFLPHPTTWFNQERWGDPIETPYQEKTVAQKRLAREMDDELTQEEINAGVIDLSYDPTEESNGAESN